jgi:lipopolysaccharide transport protein LptA
VYCSIEPRTAASWARRQAATLRNVGLLIGLLCTAQARADDLDVAKAGTPPCHEPLCYTASSLERERNRLVLYDLDAIDTTRGISHIKADRAEANGPDLGNSDWVLTGHVQVFMPEGQLHADRATVQFANKRIDTMTAQGTPALFEHPLENGQTAHGHANEITVDMEHNQLQLTGDSWLTDGCNEITSGRIAYDIATQRVRADSTPGDDARVHGTIGATSNGQCAAAAHRP